MNGGAFFACPACGRPVNPSADHSAVYAEIEQEVGATHGSRDYAPDAAWFHSRCWPNPFYRWRPRPDAPPDQDVWSAFDARALWFPFSCLVLLGVGYLIYLALVILLLGLHGDDGFREDSTPGIVQFVIAVAGLVPTLGFMVSSFLDRGRPDLWFLATVGVYGTWLLYIWRAIGF